MLKNFIFICLFTLIHTTFLYAQKSTLKIGLLKKNNPEFQQIFNSLHRELLDFNLIDFDVSKGYKHTYESISKFKPDLLIGFDTIALKYISEIQKIPKFKNTPILAISVYLEWQIERLGLKNISGISYEVSAYQLLTNFRYLTEKPIHKVLMPYRKSVYNKRYETEKVALQKENIQLIPFNVEEKGNSINEIHYTLKSKLHHKIITHNVDALWVLPDSAMINYKTLNSIWLPASNKGIPFLSVLEKFATREFDFCTFINSPDHNSLGVQLSEMVQDVIIEKIPIHELKIEPVITVKSTLNKYKAKKLKLPIINEHLSETSLID